MSEQGNLVLTVRVGEHITIGDSITVTCIASDHRGARLMVKAAKDVPIIRSDATVKTPPTAGAIIDQIIATARASGQVEPKVGP